MQVRKTCTKSTNELFQTLWTFHFITAGSIIDVAGVNKLIYYIQFARVKDLVPDTVDNGLAFFY
jgi:hypothetical protein